jgi:hypothetical protein
MIPMRPYTNLEQRAQAEWLTVPMLAIVLGVDKANARNACAKGNWRGHEFEVAKVPSPGGFAYLVKSSRLPIELQERLGAVQGAVNDPSPAVSSDFAPLVSPEDMRRRPDLIEPVLATTPGTPERALAIAEATEKGRVSQATVRRWLARHEELGVIGLARKRRADAGAGRAIAWLALDQRLRAAGLTDQEIAEPAERIRRHVRGLLASSSASSALIAQNSIGFVAQQLRAAGASVSQDDLISICRPSAEFVRAERQARLVDLRRNDAGRFAATHEPRIRRDRSLLLPMEVVCGDVAHLDVLIRRADGSTATPKAVAFQDLATNRLFYRLYLLGKGEGIRRSMSSRRSARCAQTRAGACQAVC